MSALMGQGLSAVFEENRQQLLRYLQAHGAGDEAEDLLQELWIRFRAGPTGPVASPRSYLFRAATNLIIDRRRSAVQEQQRGAEWSDASDRLPDGPANDPGPEREIDGKRRLALVTAHLRNLPERAVQVFRSHRIDGRRQREIAIDMGLSQSTIESDLRLVYQALDDIRNRFDEE
jgi:RNA polymerase sigma-70 factor (ECF subfamily)